ncbi:DUF4352 domain-containing protein [Mycolicibacterium vanbaalenii PYR-1]|uniref:DUF4352 domain-containing protein n=2 Tax=Mycobacteriaceae TaxID=1762 RepID=A1T353_MYCVP|nr:conserved hypothetical protein [Mycolicibacterium vanbaalenii PYR-1]MCV7126318.1 DUF4352 domain-containing protein [Mycolicibacterium vanbaalenii PYR-1]
MTQPTAGWYPDPSDPSRQRYFDGKTWTENYAPFPAPPPGIGQPAKPGMSRGLKIGLGVGAAVLALVAIGNIGGNEKSAETRSSSTSPSSSFSESSTSTVTSASDDDAPAPAGSTVRDGKFEFQVLGVERGATSIDDAFGPEVAKGEFFTVRLRVTNIGDDARSFSATNQKLIINGNEYEATSIMDDGWMEDINPGLGIEASATFDIPPGAVPSAIECHDSMFSGGALLAL